MLSVFVSSFLSIISATFCCIRVITLALATPDGILFVMTMADSLKMFSLRSEKLKKNTNNYFI